MNILSFRKAKLWFQKEFDTISPCMKILPILWKLAPKSTNFDFLISTSIHFLTQKSWPIELMNILNLLKLFSLAKESLRSQDLSLKLCDISNNYCQLIWFHLVARLRDFMNSIGTLVLNSLQHLWLKNGIKNILCGMLGIKQLLCSSGIQPA